MVRSPIRQLEKTNLTARFAKKTGSSVIRASKNDGIVITGIVIFTGLIDIFFSFLPIFPKKKKKEKNERSLENGVKSGHNRRYTGSN